MRRCIELALRGRGFVTPNPLVGAVLVYNDRVIGEGWHRRNGEAHAEINCLQQVAEEDKKYIPLATMYVSLEPCSHYGKTPPCADRLVAEGIAKVVIGCGDESAKVNGRGIRKLKECGVEVKVGVLEKECKELNKYFFRAVAYQRPYITLKWAQSKAGYLGKVGEKIQLSGKIAQYKVHQLRSEVAAIWVGYRTLINDSPLLTVRLIEGRSPIRVCYSYASPDSVASMHFPIPEVASLFFNQHINKLDGATEWIKIAPENPLEQILHILYQRGMNSVLVEGGAGLFAQLIEADLWDEIIQFKTPHWLGEGVAAPSIPKGAEVIHRELLHKDECIVYKNSLH